MGDVNMAAAGVTETNKGLKTGGGGRVSLTNLAGNLSLSNVDDAATVDVVEAAIDATGGRITLTTEKIDIQGDIRSERTVSGVIYSGTLTLQSLSVNTGMGVALDAPLAGFKFDLSDAELDHIIDGFDDGEETRRVVDGVLEIIGGRDGIIIGRIDGCHHMILGAYLYRDSVTFRAPMPDGRFDVIGKMGTVGNDIDGDKVEVEFLGT